MARGKFEYWLTEDGLTLLEGWARDGLTDEQLAMAMEHIGDVRVVSVTEAHPEQLRIGG